MFTRHTGLALSFAALTLLTGCDRARVAEVAGPLIGEEERAPRQHMVTKPIRGYWDNSESPPSENPPAGCFLFIETTQTGEVSHLGRFSGEGQTCGNPVGPPTASPPFWGHDPAPPYLVAEFTNEMVWTAADGSELWLRPNEGVFVQSLSNGAATVRGRLTIAGGTGRFQGASGWLSARGGRPPGATGDRTRIRGRIHVLVGRKPAAK